jgi:hypothetical protein
MKNTARPEPKEPSRFSDKKIKTFMIVVGLGVALALVVEIVDSVLPKEHKMSALIQSFIEHRDARKRAHKSSYDMERPGVGFPVTDLQGDRR